MASRDPKPLFLIREKAEKTMNAPKDLPRGRGAAASLPPPRFSPNARPLLSLATGSLRAKAVATTILILGGLGGLVASSCDSSAAPTEQFSDITGTYNASILFTNGSNAEVRGLQCVGILTVSEQDETEITGSLRRDPPCSGSASFQGRVGFGGQISLDVANDSTVTPFSANCTFAELRTFHGSVINGEIVLSRPYAFSCTQQPSGTGSEVIGASKP